MTRNLTIYEGRIYESVISVIAWTTLTTFVKLEEATGTTLKENVVSKRQIVLGLKANVAKTGTMEYGL